MLLGSDYTREPEHYQCETCNPDAPPHQKWLSRVNRVKRYPYVSTIKSISRHHAWSAYCNTRIDSLTPGQVHKSSKIGPTGEPIKDAPSSFTGSMESALDQIIRKCDDTELATFAGRLRGVEWNSKEVVNAWTREVKRLIDAKRLLDVKDLGVLAEILGYVYKGKLWSGL